LVEALADQTVYHISSVQVVWRWIERTKEVVSGIISTSGMPKSSVNPISMSISISMSRVDILEVVRRLLLVLFRSCWEKVELLSRLVVASWSSTEEWGRK